MVNRCLPLLVAAMFGCLAAADQDGGAWLAVTSWPTPCFEDERPALSFRIEAGTTGDLVLSWDGHPALAAPAPAGISEGLLPVPVGVGLHRGLARLGGLEASFAVRIVAVAGPWPALALRDGVAVDGDGVPVVLIDRRRTPNDLRRERLSPPAAANRPAGRSLVIGDPLAALGMDAWRGLDADLTPTSGAACPESAALVAVAGASQPGCVVWCPGNQPLMAGRWGTEGRLCATLGRHVAAIGSRPRLILALPPLPAPTHLQAVAERRRRALSEAARSAGWEVLDLAAIAGDPAIANRVADGLFTAYPVGVAMDRMRSALHEALRR